MGHTVVSGVVRGVALILVTEGLDASVEVGWRDVTGCRGITAEVGLRDVAGCRGITTEVGLRDVTGSSV